MGRGDAACPNGPCALAPQGPTGQFLGFPQNPRGINLGGKFPSPLPLVPLALGPRWARGQPQTAPSTYIRRGRGRGTLPQDTIVCRPLSPSSIALPRLGEALQTFLLHHHHHAVVLLGFRGDLPHLRCPLERGEEVLHRHRTHDRVRKCCRIAASDDRLHQQRDLISQGFSSSRVSL